MAKRRVVVQWVGHSDLRAMAADLPPAKQKQVMGKLRGELPAKGNVGPIKTSLQTQSFDEVRLLSNYQTDLNKRYLSWLGVKAELVRVELEKPTDYVSIFKAADSELSGMRSSICPRHSSYCKAMTISEEANAPHDLRIRARQ